MPPQLTAVAFIRLVITVGITITAPACVDAQATVTHEFPRAAGLVGRWETKGSRGPHGRAESPVSHAPPQHSSSSPEMLLPSGPAPAGTCALSAGGLPLLLSFPLARALTAVRLVRPVSAVIVAVTVVYVQDAAAIGTLELLQVARRRGHC